MAKTPAQILAEINALYVSNNEGAIEATEVRGTFQDLIALDQQIISLVANARAGASRTVVIDMGTQEPPDGPVLVDAYVLGAVPTGAWAGHAGDIAHWIGDRWAFVTPIEGSEVYNQFDNLTYMFDGSAWGPMSLADHGALSGLTDDDHPQYHNDARGDARYDALGTAAAALAAHVLVVDPHGQYLTPAEADTLYAALAHAHVIADVSGLLAALDAKLDDSQATSVGLSMLGAANAAAQTALLNVFTSGLKGLVPPSGGGTTTYLRADGTFTIPDATGGGGAPDTVDYLVKTTSPNLSAERVVGNSPTIIANWDIAGQVTFHIVGGGTATVPTDFKDSVAVATTANIALSGEQTIDGVLTASSRVLVKDQTNGAQNGIYTTSAAAWGRTADCDTSAEVTPGMMVLVEGGTLNGDQVFILTTNGTITLGTTALAFQAIAVPANVFIGKTVSTTTYTTVLLDGGKRLYGTHASPKTITIAPQASVNYAVNTEIEICNIGAGLLTIAPGAAVTLNSLSGILTVPQYHCVKAKKRANPNTWEVTGVIGTAAVKNIGTSGDAVPLLNAANTWALSQTFSAGYYINGAAGTWRDAIFKSAGVDRWYVSVTDAAESGSNVGSDFWIGAYDDAGDFLHEPIIVRRNTGNVEIKSLTLTTDLAVADGGTGSSTAAGARTNLGAAPAVGLQTIFVPATAMTPRTTNGPAVGSVETATNKIMLSSLDFDATTQEFAQFQIRMPKSWNRGTITAVYTWSHAATTVNFGVVWALEAQAFADNSAADVAFSGSQQIADTGGVTNNIYISPASPVITIGGSPAGQDYVVFQVKRVPPNANDTLAVDARLHGVTIYYMAEAGSDDLDFTTLEEILEETVN